MTAEAQPNKPRVLVVEDDLSIRRFLRAALEVEGYEAIEAADSKEALRQATSQPPDVMLLDLGLPDGDGLDVLRRFREWSAAPVIVLSARERESDKVAALDAGADDYVTKPFSAGELAARIRVALRHSARQGEAQSSIFTSGELKVDLGLRQVWVSGEEVHLTPTEYRLLTTLVRNAGKVVPHSKLLKEVWGPHSVYETQYLRVFVGQLRKKLERDPMHPQIIRTEPGVGYRLLE